MLVHLVITVISRSSVRYSVVCNSREDRIGPDEAGTTTAVELHQRHFKVRLYRRVVKDSSGVSQPSTST
jgi:hypothetical protein